MPLIEQVDRAKHRLSLRSFGRLGFRLLNRWLQATARLRSRDAPLHDLAPHDPRRSRADGGARRSRRGLSPRGPASGSRWKVRGTIAFPRSRPSCTASSGRRSTTWASTRHASAVTIVVRREARRVCCSVRDDGVGFDPGTARSTVKGIGLIRIRERSGRPRRRAQHRRSARSRHRAARGHSPPMTH